MTTPMADGSELPGSDRYDDVVEWTDVVARRDGELRLVCFRPNGEGPWPAVVLAPEAYGINDFTRRVAATLAHEGRVVVVVDYHRDQQLADPEDYSDFTEVMGFIGGLDFTRAFADVEAGVDHALELPDVDPSRVAVWGYCTGGTLAMVAACLHRGVAAGVLFFPSQPWFEALDLHHPVQPVDLLWHATCPLVLVYGDADGVLTPERAVELQRRIDGWKVDATLLRYPDAGHAFTVPFEAMRNDAADRASWHDVRAWLADHL